MARIRGNHVVSMVAAALVLLTGGAVLLAWLLDVDSVTWVFPGHPTMKPNTALCLMTASVALLVLHASREYAWLRWCSFALAIGLVALSGTSLIQDLSGVSVGIDRVLADMQADAHGVDAGRMAFNASVSFVLMGISLLLLSLRTGYPVVQGLAIVAAFIALLALIGYLYSVEPLYGIAFFSRMSIPTALLLSVLATGILAYRVDRGVMAIVVSDTSAGVIMRRLLPIALVLPIAAGYLRLLGEEAGYYGTHYGAALFALLIVIFFAGLVWWNSISVYRAELARRRAEAEIVRLNRDLQRRVGELQTVLEVVPVGLAVAHDPACKNMTGNPAFEEMLRVAAGQNISKTGDDADKLPFRVMRSGEEVPPDRLPMQYAASHEVSINGEEYEIIHSDGSTATLLEYAAPLYDERGRVRGALGAFVDITQQKRTEARLREQTRTLETINRINTQLAAELDVENLVQTLTEAGKDLTRAAYGAFFYNVLTDEGESYMQFALSGAARDAYAGLEMHQNEGIFEPTFRGEGIIRLDDVTQDPRFGKIPPHHGLPDSHLPVRSYLAAPVVARSGDVLGALFFGHPDSGIFNEQDERLIAGISDQAAIALENARLFTLARKELVEREKVESRLLDLNETLEARVGERTAALERTNKRLRSEVAERARAERAVERTNEALRQSNRELQDFAYVASHDLQEPLRKIGSFAGLLKSEYASDLDEIAQFYVERMQNAAERMSQLIHDLLSFSRITTQGRPFTMIDLDETLRGVLSDLEVKIHEANARVIVDDLPLLEADPTQMGQLFQNLISNAIKFQASGRDPVVRISASMRRRHDVLAGPQLETCRIEVKDNGIGFDEKYVEKLFSPFQRLHAQTEYPGTGMGLAICRRIVERHHGTITARSREGDGSTFVIYLPVRQPVDEEVVAER